MSLFFSSVEVNGPIAGIKEQQVNLPVFVHGGKQENVLEVEMEKKTEDLAVIGRRVVNGFSFGTEEEEEADGSSESSSIGGESSLSLEVEEERGSEVQSKLKLEGALGSLDSLEESLPIKRGLSNFFRGKSKSFASLSDATAGSAKDLAKHENPFNKRRRILMTNKTSWSRRASYSSLNMSLASLLSPDFAVKEGEEEDDKGEKESPLAPLPKPLPYHGGGRGLNKTFKSPRSFSLSDLQHV